MRIKQIYLGACSLLSRGAINPRSLSRLAFSGPSSSGSIADDLRLRERGMLGVEALRTLFTIRVR